MEFVYRGLVKIVLNKRRRVCLRYDTVQYDSFGNAISKTGGLISLDRKWIRPCNHPSVSGTWHKVHYNSSQERYEFPDAHEPDKNKNYHIHGELIRLLDNVTVEIELLSMPKIIEAHEGGG